MLQFFVHNLVYCFLCQILLFYFTNQRTFYFSLISSAIKYLIVNILKSHTMNDSLQQKEQVVKQEHSQIYTLKSINSGDEMIDVIPVYNNDETFFEFNSGHWSAKQHIKYIMFIDYFSNLFVFKHNKKLWKIFTIMSNFIKTRNSSQCRSHHQKTQRKYTTIQQVLSKQRKKYRNYEIQYQKMKKVLNQLPIDNPMQIDKQKQTANILPGIKILQQNIDYKLNRNTISMINIEISQKTIDKSKPFITEKLINYQNENFIGSQCSIQMEDQEKQLSRQEKQISRQRQLNFLIHNSKTNQQNHQKLKPLYSQINDPYEKNHKFIKTTNTQREQKKKQFSNIVKMRRTMLSQPSFDLISTTGDSQCENRVDNIKSIKKQFSQPQNKCKTYLAQSQRQDSSQQSSCMSEKIYYKNQQPIAKSLFSCFVSSISSGAKQFQKSNILGHDQYTSFNNLCNANYAQQNYQQLFFSNRKKNNKTTAEQRINQNICRRQNIFYCQDRKKGNVYNQISGQSSEVYENQPIQFVQHIKFAQSNKNIYKIDEIAEKNDQNSSVYDLIVRKFQKKKSSENSDPNKKKQKKEQFIQESHNSEPNYMIQNQIQSANLSQNSQNIAQIKIQQNSQNHSQRNSQKNSQGFRPYSNQVAIQQQNQQHDFQLFHTFPPQNYFNYSNYINYYANFYNSHFMYVPPYSQQAYLCYQFRNFLQFYIGFIIWILSINNQNKKNNG